MSEKSTMVSDAQTAIEAPENEEARTLNRDAILSADESCLLECIEVPEWGGDVYIRVMSGAERDALEAEMTGEKKNLANFRARFAVKVLADETGKRLFSDKDAEALGRKSGLALDRVLKDGLKINGFDKAEIDTLEKN
jgi:hypothetical protein